MNIIAYILALPVILLIYTVASAVLAICTIRIARLGRDAPALSIGIGFVNSFLSAGVGVFSFFELCQMMGVVPSFYMIFIPLVAFGLNDVSRINQASAGTSRVARMLEAEGKEYDAGYFVKLNTAHLLGQQIAFFGVTFVMGIPL